MKIAILSRNPNSYSTKRLVEAGKKRGHEIIVLDHLKCVLVIEKNKPHIYYSGEPVKGVNAVIPRIGVSATFYGAAVVRQFEMMKIFTAVESQALVRSRDKLRSLQLLARAGIGMPKTAFASTTKYVDNLIEQAGGAPVVVKLLEGTQGIGVSHGVWHRQGKPGVYRGDQPGGARIAIYGHVPSGTDINGGGRAGGDVACSASRLCDHPPRGRRRGHSASCRSGASGSGL